MGDLHDVAAWVSDDDDAQAKAFAHHARLESAVIDGTATDEQIAEYVVLRDASWARHESWIVKKPAPVLYGYDDDDDNGLTLQAADSNDTAPGLETEPAAPGLAVVVVITDRGLVHQLRRNGDRVCDVAQFGALPVSAEMMDDAGLPRHAAAFRRWHDVDHDRPSPGDDITHEAFDAMGRES